MKEQSKKKATQKILDWMRGESEEFMKSGAGKNNSDYVPIKGDIGKNPDKKHGSGFGNAYGAPSVQVDPKSKTMNGKQIADFISEHARGNHGAQINDFGAGLKIKNPNDNVPTIKLDGINRAPSEYKKNVNPFDKYKSQEFVTKKQGMSDVEKAALGGAAGATAGEVISGLQDLDHAKKRRDAEQQSNQTQQDAHGYWTRRKNGQ